MENSYLKRALRFLSELCFGIMNATKDSYLLNSKVVFLKSGQNAAGICPFFYGAHVQIIVLVRYKKVPSDFLGLWFLQGFL